MGSLCKLPPLIQKCGCPCQIADFPSFSHGHLLKMLLIYKNVTLQIWHLPLWMLPPTSHLISKKSEHPLLKILAAFLVCGHLQNVEWLALMSPLQLENRSPPSIKVPAPSFKNAPSLWMPRQCKNAPLLLKHGCSVDGVDAHCPVNAKQKYEVALFAAGASWMQRPYSKCLPLQK